MSETKRMMTIMTTMAIGDGYHVRFYVQLFGIGLTSWNIYISATIGAFPYHPPLRHISTERSGAFEHTAPFDYGGYD